MKVYVCQNSLNVLLFVARVIAYAYYLITTSGWSNFLWLAEGDLFGFQSLYWKCFNFFISPLIIVHMHCFSVLAAYFAFHCFIVVHRLDVVQAMTQLYILPSWQFGHCFYDNEWNAQVASVWLITAAIVDGYSCWW